MLIAAVDACERVAALHYAETAREATIDIGGQKVSVHDFLVTAWTYPEKLRDQVIRERLDTGVDLRYVPEAARILLGPVDKVLDHREVRSVMGWEGYVANASGSFR
ncbi:hypothetical protein CFBP4996_25290 [Agrobacterium leguminum]|nr:MULTISPECIES: hypothetical protein [Agrobacterium]WFS69296.1 hypothetical protein CFBP4996_25290 [Agrobacterium leguminum]